MQENKDVKRAFLFRGILVILRPLSWYALFTAAIFVHIVYGEYKVRPNHPLVYVAAAFVIFVPYLLGWLTEVVKLSAFSGRITSIRLEKELKTRQSMTRARLKDDHHSWVVYFEITTKRNRKITFSIQDPSFKDAGYFKTGDLVRHYWGSKYLEKALKTGDEDVLCLVCGELCRMGQDICYGCRHTLVKKSGYYVSE